MRIIQRAKSALVALMVATMAVIGVAPSVALADSSRMVTLGVDLTPEQRATVLKFFNLTEDDLKDMEVINVNNQDERRYLEGTLSDDIIGWKTYSCSYIEPKTSGGLRVETANLTYVTKNTLYNALQTAGVENCSLVVTAPFPVSGTGALTGVFMAYEQRGVKLDEGKKEAATEELVQTAALEEQYGEGVAEVISDVKDEVISQGGDLSDDEIREIIKTAAKLKGINLTDEDIDTILGIVQKLQGLDYDLSSFSNTLDDFKQALDDATGKAEEAKGFFESIADWFQGIIDWFKGLFGGAPTGQTDDATAEIEGDSLIGDLNTDVFSLDGTDGATSAAGDATASTEATDAADVETDTTGDNAAADVAVEPTDSPVTDEAGSGDETPASEGEPVVTDSGADGQEGDGVAVG